jgi:hypothetical protein
MEAAPRVITPGSSYHHPEAQTMRVASAYLVLSFTGTKGVQTVNHAHTVIYAPREDIRRRRKREKISQSKPREKG